MLQNILSNIVVGTRWYKYVRKYMTARFQLAKCSFAHGFFFLNLISLEVNSTCRLHVKDCLSKP